jgi:hypothetical protein
MDALQKAIAAARESEATRLAAYLSGEKAKIAAANARCANTQDNLLAALDHAPQPQASLNEPFGTAERLPQPQAEPVGEWAMVERAAIVGICRILERDGDEHGAAAELRQLLRAAPQPQASAEDVALVAGAVIAHVARYPGSKAEEALDRLRASLGVKP